MNRILFWYFHSVQSWGKGVVFVNGQNLGRYWCVGPQHHLYLPGVWLRSGENQVHLKLDSSGRILVCRAECEIKVTFKCVFKCVLLQIVIFEEEKASDKLVFSENAEYERTVDVYKLPFCTLL